VLTSPIPIFPLGLVLFPGAVVPLHLFEPRYRAMLMDVGATTKRFGIVAPPNGTGEADLPTGRIGCVAEITSVEMLPDGRANILVEGRERFRFETYLEIGTPYRVAHVDDWTDLTDDPVMLDVSATQLRGLAYRALVASMTLHDIEGEPPTFGEDAATLGYQVAQLLMLGPDALYGILADRSPRNRLDRIERLLRARLPQLEEAAELHRSAEPDDDPDPTSED
jgi:Lon protease-like protein